MISGEADQIRWGGVVAEIFLDRRKPGRFSGGGGSRRNFPGSPQAWPIQWGGGWGSSRNVWASPKTVSQPHSVGSGRFFFFGNARSRSIKLPQFRTFFRTFPGHLEITRN